MLMGRICGSFMHVEVLVIGEGLCLGLPAISDTQSTLSFGLLVLLIFLYSLNFLVPLEHTEVLSGPSAWLLTPCFSSASCSPGNSVMDDEQAEEMPSLPQCNGGGE